MHPTADYIHTLFPLLPTKKTHCFVEMTIPFTTTKLRKKHIIADML